MNRYTPRIHTTEHLAQDLASLREHDESLRIVGSLGRAVYHNLAYGDAYREFTHRQQSPLRVGSLARDIDIISPRSTPRDLLFPLDADAYDNPEVTLNLVDETWWLTSAERNFAEPLHPDVMQPIVGATIDDIEITTIPWQTHLALTRTRGPLRPKDRVSSELLGDAGRQLGNTLPLAHFQPFETLSSLAMPAHTRFARTMYRRLPESIKHTTAPVLKSAGLIR